MKPVVAQTNKIYFPLSETNAVRSYYSLFDSITKGLAANESFFKKRYTSQDGSILAKDLNDLRQADPYVSKLESTIYHYLKKFERKKKTVTEEEEAARWSDSLIKMETENNGSLRITQRRIEQFERKVQEWTMPLGYNFTLDSLNRNLIVVFTDSERTQHKINKDLPEDVALTSMFNVLSQLQLSLSQATAKQMRARGGKRLLRGKQQQEATKKQEQQQEDSHPKKPSSFSPPTSSSISEAPRITAANNDDDKTSSSQFTTSSAAGQNDDQPKSAALSSSILSHSLPTTPSSPTSSSSTVTVVAIISSSPIPIAANDDDDETSSKLSTTSAGRNDDQPKSAALFSSSLSSSSVDDDDDVVDLDLMTVNPQQPSSRTEMNRLIARSFILFSQQYLLSRNIATIQTKAILSDLRNQCNVKERSTIDLAYMYDNYCTLLSHALFKTLRIDACTEPFIEVKNDEEEGGDIRRISFSKAIALACARAGEDEIMDLVLREYNSVATIISSKQTRTLSTFSLLDLADRQLIARDDSRSTTAVINPKTNKPMTLSERQYIKRCWTNQAVAGLRRQSRAMSVTLFYNLVNIILDNELSQNPQLLTVQSNLIEMLFDKQRSALDEFVIESIVKLGIEHGVKQVTGIKHVSRTMIAEAPDTNLRLAEFRLKDNLKEVRKVISKALRDGADDDMRHRLKSLEQPEPRYKPEPSGRVYYRRGLDSPIAKRGGGNKKKNIKVSKKRAIDKQMMVGRRRFLRSFCY
eukprot:scaffold2640_cov166-Ochromonas_danica.AAC.1